MATYYKYAERSADSQVNWAEVGKGISDMLADEAKIREEKKAAYETAFQDDMKQLSTQPQGDWQDGTNVVNNFAHNMMAQKLIDYKLLKSGKMKPRDYTLRQQNYTNQTNSVLDLNKRLQEKRGKAITAFEAGNLQAMSISDLSDVQEYTDFANAEIIIDPYSSAFSMGKMEERIIDGKRVKVVSKNTLPVNIASILIESNKLPYDVNKDIDNTVKGFGTQINVLKELATQTKAGSITKLTGIGPLERSKDPQFKGVIEQFNQALDQKIKEFITNKDNLASILTTQLNYNVDSFTRSPEVAKEKGKILKKIDPITHFSTLDESGPNYKEQVKEASDWIRTQILSKMDNKVEVELGGFAPQPRQPSQYEYARADARKAGKAAVGAWNQLYTGKTAAEKQAAADILLGTPNAQSLGLLGIDVSTPGRVKLTYADSKKNRDIPMIDASGKPISIYDFAAIGTELHGVTDRNEAVKAGGGGSGYGALTKEQLKDVKATRTGGGGVAPVVDILPELFTVRSGPSTKSLQSLLGPSFKVTDMGGPFGNDVEVTAPNGQKFTYNANLKKDEAAIAKADLEQFIKVNGAPVGDSGGGGVDYGNK
jgi:hypothetical protein